MKTLTLTQFRTELKAQGVADRTHYAFKCPLCQTVQSIQSFLCVGVDGEAAEKAVGFSCVGRFTGAGSPRKEPDGKPCNWTLGGLLRFHNLEVVDDEGKTHPFFDVATLEEAQLLESSQVAA